MFLVTEITREDLLGAIARGWCTQMNEHKTMDPDLAEAIAWEVQHLIVIPGIKG